LSPAIIHRDLKSHNILKADNGSFKLCDFGLVRNRNAAAGTPAYMAPELLNNGNFTKSVDCYAMGMVLWEIFVREIPFGRMDVAEIRQKVLSGRRPAIPSYSLHHRIAALITKCWSQNPEDRPTASEIVDELLELERLVPSSSFAESTKDSVGDILDNFLDRK
jgi:serine/threonine-protein kinase TNNI3K